MVKRPTIIAGNWKMHKTTKEAVQFVHALAPQIKSASCRILVAPSFTAIGPCSEAAANTSIEIGAQNMSDRDEGAFTGEVSARMLKDVGATFVILGHSERRQHFNEIDEHIHHKLNQALRESMPPILCIGESEQERDSGRSEAVLKKQLDGALNELTEQELNPLMIAYEPVWAIGTGKSATPEIAEETHKAIRAHLADKWSYNFAEQIPILYGGSVKPNNIEPLLNQPNIDGALIGGASLDVEAFSTMVLR